MVRFFIMRNLVGILFIDKPIGITSSLVDKICKRTFGLSKAGHVGTLDPFASGLLPVAFNGATKLIPYIKWTDTKTYVFEIEFGTQTDTGDVTGKVVATTGIIPTKQQTEDILSNFIGQIQQKPHVYSAVKINGKKSYELARRGIYAGIKTKPVKIYDLKLIKQINDKAYKLEATVSSGTYIRSLTEDIALALGSVGYTKTLRRTKIGCYGTSVTLDQIKNCRENINEVVEVINDNTSDKVWLSVDNILDDIPVVNVLDSEATDLRLGRTIRWNGTNGVYLVKSLNGFVNLSECENGYLQPKRLIRNIGV